MKAKQEPQEQVPKFARTEARPPEALGDFTTTLRVLPISGLAIVIGAVSAGVALLLLRLIGLFTNLFYFARWSTAMVSPVGNHLGLYAVFVPVIGALVIGVMARYGSERIRGHGIPEAIEAILINGSRVEPKVAILKPLSSAISIGSRGPFGATRMPVVERQTRQLLELISLDDLLKARTRHLGEERRRARGFSIGDYFPGGKRGGPTPALVVTTTTLQ